MPVLNRIGAKYARQGLVILAVNVGESRSNYQGFIDSSRYAHLQWVWDGSGEITRMYKVRGIPVTYILDQEGVIRYARVGYGDKMSATLEKEISALLR